MISQLVFAPIVGKGCQHCEIGRPAHKVISEYGTVVLCAACAAKWWDGRVPVQLELE